MTWPIAYFETAVAAGSGNGVPAGIFIPQSNLPGILQAGELDEPNREAKAAYAIVTKVQDVLQALTSKLGLSSSRSMASTGVLDRISQTFLLSCQFMVNHSTNLVSVLPLPGSEAGKVSLADLFPAHALVAAEGAVPGPGVVIPTAMITQNGGTLPGAAIADARSWLIALYQSMILGLTPSDAVVSPSRGSATGLTPLADFTATTNPTTGINAADLPKMSFLSLTYSVTLQIVLNQTTQTFDLVA
jgi:hypothetical protein